MARFEHTTVYDKNAGKARHFLFDSGATQLYELQDEDWRPIAKPLITNPPHDEYQLISQLIQAVQTGVYLSIFDAQEGHIYGINLSDPKPEWHRLGGKLSSFRTE